MESILTRDFLGTVRGSPQAGASNFCIIKTPRSLVYNYQPYHRAARAPATALVAHGAAVSDTCHHFAVAVPLNSLQLFVHIHAATVVCVPSTS